MKEAVIAICPRCKTKNRIVIDAAKKSQPLCGKCRNYVYIEAPGYPVEANDKNFDDNVVRSGTITLVDFYSTRCAPCKTMEPVIEQLAYDMAGNARVVKFNVDRNSYIPSKFGIRAVPTFVVFRGIELGRLTGAQPVENLKELIERYKPER